MLLFDYCNYDFFVPANDEVLAAASHNSRFRSTVEPMRTLCVCVCVRLLVEQGVTPNCSACMQT